MEQTAGLRNIRSRRIAAAEASEPEGRSVRYWWPQATLKVLVNFERSELYGPESSGQGRAFLAF